MSNLNSNAQRMEDIIEGKQKKTAPKYVGIIIALVLLAACSFGAYSFGQSSAILPGMTKGIQQAVKKAAKQETKKGIQQAMTRAMMLVMATATMQAMMMALQESSAVRKISLMLTN